MFSSNAVIPDFYGLRIMKCLILYGNPKCFLFLPSLIKRTCKLFTIMIGGVVIRITPTLF